MNALPEPNPVKYTKPSIRGTVRRSRLIDFLRENAAGQVYIVTGQAAQGKSTLAADFLQDSGADAAWMHLGREDGVAADFYNLFIHALQNAADAGNDFSDLLQPAFVTLAHRHDPCRFGARMRNAFERLHKPLYLVLDNLDRIPPDAAAFQLLQELVDRTPPGVKLFILSRRAPRLRLRDLKVKRSVFCLGNEDLAFTRGEIRDFFRSYHRVLLEDDAVERLFMLTGGWAGGLVLISQTLLSLSEEKVVEYIMDGLPEKMRADTVQYFNEVVFSDQPERVRRFLTRTAIFDAVEPPIAGELTGFADHEEILENLVRRNAFVQEFHDERLGSVFRYNHMFRDFLLARFRTDLDPEERTALYLKAGELLGKRRRREDAVEFFLLAEDFRKAADAIKAIGIDLCIRGRFQELEDWLAKLPEDFIDEDPWLFLILTLTRRYRGGKRSLRDFQIALERFEGKKDVRGTIMTLAYLIEATVFQDDDLNARRVWLERARRLLEDLAGVPYFTYARTLLWLEMGLGYISGGVDVQKGLSASKNAELLATKMGDPELRANAGIVSVLGYATTGEFEEAEKVLARIRPLSGSAPCPEHTVFQNIIGSELCLKKGALEEAERLLDLARKEIETYGLLFLYPEYLYAEGQLHIRRGQCQKAMASFRQLRDASVISGNIYHRGLSQRLEASALFFQSRYSEARKAIQEAICSFEAMEGDTVHLMRARLMLGLICTNLGQFEEAARAFESSAEFFEANGHLMSVVETRMCQGLMRHAAGQPEDCRKQLRKGFGIAERKGYRYFAVLRPFDFSLACELASELDEPRIAAYAKLLFATVAAGSTNSTAGYGLFAEKSEREPATSAEAANAPFGQTPPDQPKHLHIRTFGGFHVCLEDETPISAKRWGGRRSKLLLKAIVSHGGQEVPSDILMDELWPESPEKTARGNLKVTLHRLRKVLEPDLDADRGSSYVHLKDNRISLDRRLCLTDVEEFTRCCKESARRENASDSAKVLKLGERAVELYRGDFLPEDPYEPWVEIKRLALKEVYINLLFRMVEILRARGDMDDAARFCAKITEAEPCLERAARSLMEIYAASGRSAEALLVFETFKKRLRQDIGVEPDQSTTRLYRRILSNRR